MTYGLTDCHVHVFDPAAFPYAADRRYTPGAATVDQLQALHRRLGVERVVLVQPSVYGSDNRALLAALQRLGARARGVAVIDANFGRAQLAELFAQGVRAVRLNLQVNHASDGAAAAMLLRHTADQLAGSGLFVQLNAALPVVLACAPTLRTLDLPVLIDHFAQVPAHAGVRQPGFDQLLALLQHPQVHIKLSGPHQLSHDPAYADVAPLARALLLAAPQRVVWGSDWPHTGGAQRSATQSPTTVEPFRHEDDAALLALANDWAGDALQRRRLFVDNPATLFGF